MVWLFAVTTMLDATNSVGYWEHKKWTLVGFFFMLINKHLVYAVCYALSSFNLFPNFLVQTTLSSFNLFPNFLVQTKMECCFLLSLKGNIFEICILNCKMKSCVPNCLGFGKPCVIIIQILASKTIKQK